MSGFNVKLARKNIEISTLSQQRRKRGTTMSLEYIQGLHDKVTNNEVVRQLRVALAGGFNAAHNLGMQAAMIQGYQKVQIQKQLVRMHKSEQEHIISLINRIMELGGHPDIRPIQWDNLAQCDYRPITTTDQKDILDITYRSKRCKTAFYGKLLLFLEPRDRTSFDMVNRIQDEEFQDMELIKKLQTGLQSNQEKEAIGAVAEKLGMSPENDKER